MSNLLSSALLMADAMLQRRLNLFRRVCKIAKMPVIFVISVFPSVRTEQLGPHWTDFHEILQLRIFENLSENSSFIKI
jgi:hypothetical protein